MDKLRRWLQRVPVDEILRAILAICVVVSFLIYLGILFFGN